MADTKEYKTGVSIGDWLQNNDTGARVQVKAIRTIGEHSYAIYLAGRRHVRVRFDRINNGRKNSYTLLPSTI